MASSIPTSASTPTPESWDAPTLLSLLPRLTFTQGLVVGQLSIILVVVALVRYLLFEDHAAGGADEASGQRSDEAANGRSFPQDTARRPATGRANSSLLSLSLSSLAPSRAKSPPLPPLNSSDEKAGSGPALPTLARIPDAVGYDMETASDCDVGWLNVLLAHVWEGYRDDFLAGGSRAGSSSDAGADAAAPRSARTFMQDVLNRRRSANPQPPTPSFLDPISVSSIHPGSSYPLLSNARVRPRDDAGRVRIEVDVDYTDVVSLDVTTALCLNFPRPRFAVLPVSLGVRITRFSGTLSLCVVSHSPAVTGEEKRSRHSLEVSLHPDFLLLATCSSLVGSRAKLQDIPKIQQVMMQRIRGAILDKVGWPRSWTVEMPDLVTGRGSAVEREEGGEEREGEEWEEEDEGELYDEEGEGDGWEGYEDEMEDELDARYWQQQQQRYARRPPAQHLNGHAHGSRGEVDVNVTPRPRRRAAAPGAAATSTGAAPRSGAGAGGAGPARRRRPAAAATPPLPSAPASMSIPRPPPSADQLTSISRRPAPQRHHTATTTSKSAPRNGAQPPRTPPPPVNGVEAWRKEMVRKTRGGTPGAERRLN